MTNWVEMDGGSVANQAVDSANSRGVRLTAPGSTNTKSSWVELTSSADYDAPGFLLVILNGVASSALIDIGYGGAGSEQIVAPNIPQTRAISALGDLVVVPVPVVAGTRIAARIAANVSSAARDVGLLPWRYGALTLPLPGACSHYGISTALSYGTSITTSASTNTKGAWAQLTASTTRTFRKFVVCVGTRSAAMSNATYLMDLAIGAASSEQIIVPDQLLIADASDNHVAPIFLGPYNHNIPAGTRLAGRAQAGVANQALSLSVIGFD